MAVRIADVEDVRAAAGVIHEHLSPSPLVRSYALERELGLPAGRRAWIKDYGWTPVGSFKPFRMVVDHFSKEWDDAPMPYSIFFTPEGHAIHGSPHTKRLGMRASHGCVRLAPANAAKLYALVQKTGMKNTRVVIRGGFDFDFGFSDFAGALPRKPNWTKRRNPFADLFD